MAVATYAGDVSPEETWRAFEQDRKAVLVDVRTTAEWAFVGVPDLSAVGREPLRVEWQSFPGGTPNAQFVGQLESALSALAANRDTPIYFLCRSGGRSASAAVAMTRAGYARCFNVAGGFEGGRDGSGHRGTVEGWKASGLPWVQS
ncbi:rhodanese-like domain-containing protein [Faunimonas sp. B44]|uniref:rhodanese-like domain-containing protein n=1 Tax=Faunimonas sp. B44 TaxID=3461493 RepID=UPI00404467E6